MEGSVLRVLRVFRVFASPSWRLGKMSATTKIIGTANTGPKGGGRQMLYGSRCRLAGVCSAIVALYGVEKEMAKLGT